jgi:hypothetical protein
LLKIDLSKAYDKVSWLYIGLLLTQLGFKVPFINWVMSCISTVSFVVLINGETLGFFNYERGLRQGCLLSSLLFLLIVEGIDREIENAKLQGGFQGITITPTLRLSRLLFDEDMIIFCNGLRGDAEKLE